jgi:hypothetical protein
MQPKLLLNIPQPCSQNWEGMTTNEQGRFCNACTKTVVDFTTMSDNEVLNFFKNKALENVCGRLATDQIDRFIEHTQTPKKAKFWYISYFVAMLLILFKPWKAAAQGGIRVSQCRTPNMPDTIRGQIKKVDVSAKVVDSNNEPVPHASIQVKGTSIGMLTDDKGYFKLKQIDANAALIPI